MCAAVVQFRKLFLQDGTCGRTGLHLAVESHNINMISFLLKNGANIDAVTFAGNTALHLASGHHMDQVVELLVGNGANAKIKNYEGDLALYPRVNDLKITLNNVCFAATDMSLLIIASILFGQSKL